jgi:cytoskeleton-associated protein 5
VAVSSHVGVKIVLQKADDLYSGSQRLSLDQYLDALKEVPTVQKVVKTVKIENLLISIDKGKDSRQLLDRGGMKWTFESPRRELIDLLSDQCRPSFNADLHQLLFSNDHYKEKDFLQAIKQIDSFLRETMDEQVAISNCDLILKYLTIRFFDTNTSIFIKSLDLLEILLTILDTAGYRLNEYEANLFMPFFVLKLGDPKETMRVKLRLILKQLGRVYPVSKLFMFLLKGLDSKNSKTRYESLDELSSLILRNGASVFDKKSVILIASQVGDRDATIRNSALQAVCEIYAVLGDEMYTLLGRLSQKDKDLILERVKRIPAKRKEQKKLPLPKDVMEDHIKRTGTSKEIHISRNETQSQSDDNPRSTRIQFSLDLDKFDLPEMKLKERVIERFPTLERSDGGLDQRLDIIMVQLAGFDLEKTLEATRNLEKLIVANPDLSIIKSRDIVGIVNPLSNNAFASVNANNLLSVKLCKHFTSIMVQIFSTKESATKVPYDSLEECIRKILFRLVDPCLQTLDSSKTIPRALNMLMVRIIDNCHPNFTFKYKKLT